MLLEYAAFLSRLGLNALAVRYTALATATAETLDSPDEALPGRLLVSTVRYRVRSGRRVCEVGVRDGANGIARVSNNKWQHTRSFDFLVVDASVYTRVAALMNDPTCT